MTTMFVTLLVLMMISGKLVRAVEQKNDHLVIKTSAMLKELSISTAIRDSLESVTRMVKPVFLFPKGRPLSDWSRTWKNKKDTAKNRIKKNSLA